jgi:hypothetical protein
MFFLSPIFDLTRTATSAGLSVARWPFELAMSVRPTIIEVKIGLIHVGENVAARCIRELKLSYLSAPPTPNIKFKLELVDKDFLERFPVTQSDMALVSGKLRRNILQDTGSWLSCEKSHIRDNRVTMIFAPKIRPLSLTA